MSKNGKPKTIQVPAIFSGFSSRADGGATMRFASNELSAEDFGLLKEFHNSFGYVLFRPNQFTEEDMPTTDAEDESKTPSQRLRAALFVLWKQKSNPKPDFDRFYRQQMEKVIERVKACLD